MIPKLRFPEFVDEWKLVRLNEVASLINGLTYSPSMVCDEGILVLRSSNVQNGILTYSDNVFVADTDYKAVKEGDILMCVRNGSRSLIGKTAVIDKDAAGLAFGAFMVAIRSKSVVNQSFLSQIFQTKIFFRDVHRNLGATINSINNSSLNRFQFGIPSNTKETKKLGSFFELLSYKINLLTKKKEALETYKKGLMQKIFSQELRFRREDGTDYPEWEYLPLNTFCEIIRGITYDSGNVCSDGGTLVLRSTNIQSNKLDLSEGTKQFIDVTPKSRLVLKDKDIIVCMSNGSKKLVGKSAVFNQGDYDGIITAGGFCAIFRSNNILTPYLLQSDMWKRYLHILLSGSSINNLRNNEVSQLRFQVPSKEEAIWIRNLFCSVDSKIEYVTNQIEETGKMKKGLLQQMFV